MLGLICLIDCLGDASGPEEDDDEPQTICADQQTAVSTATDDDHQQIVSVLVSGGEEVEEAEHEADEERGQCAARRGEARECAGEPDEADLDHARAIAVGERRADRQSAEGGAETPHRIQPLVHRSRFIDAEIESRDGGEEPDIRE